MKAHIPLFTAIVWAILLNLATGTPEREIKIEERLLGSNSEGFITLRSEIDNLGSHYSYRTRRFLVEYSKLQADPRIEDLGAEVRSKLLLDVSTSIDTDQPGKQSEEVNTKDDDVKLAELLSRFPDLPKKWNDEKSSMIECHSTAGASVGRIQIAWGGWIKARFGADRNDNLEWTLGEVFEDANCLYLSVNSEIHGQRIVSIPPRKTQQVRDHLAKQPVYLVAGKFKNREDAVTRGRELIEKTKEKFKPEVWSSGRWKEEMIFVLVDSQSAEHIIGNAFETLEAMTGVNLTVMSSQNFDERFAVVSSELEAKIEGGQGGAHHPATAPQSKPEGEEKPEPETEKRIR